MRKAFNFFRSYYDVGKELSDKDRLLFYDALFLKQFENMETDLNGMSKFAYLSQKHSIEAQIKGYFDKTKDPTFDPCQGGRQPPTQPPTVQVQEKGEVQVQEKGEVQVQEKGEGEDIDGRKLKFATTLKEFNSIYPREMLKEFYDYWTEPNKSNTKFKQELQKTWSLSRRLETWSKNENNFKNSRNGTEQLTTEQLIANIQATEQKYIDGYGAPF